jgi:hypothetical protein
MATESKIALLNVAPIAQRTHASRFFAAILEYWALTKPEVNFLILITTFAGFYRQSCETGGDSWEAAVKPFPVSGKQRHPPVVLHGQRSIPVQFQLVLPGFAFR